MKPISCAALAVVSLAAVPATAQSIALKPLIDARLRYEFVDQDGIAKEADALTLRVRAGLQATRGHFSTLVESEALLAMDRHYNSGTNGLAQYPLVADPQNIELNRAQIQYRDPALAITVGRQRIQLDDQRFVGNIGWRQNEQTFDAARVEWTGIRNLKVDTSFIWSVRTQFGIDGTGARPQSIAASTILANASYATPIGQLVGFAYLIDEHQDPVRTNSSQTYGVRFTGSRPIAKAVKLNYTGSYAHQSDYKTNPNRYSADYYFGELGLTVGRISAGGGYEVLGADDGRTLTSFQTPLATIHQFQGWADKFITTPPNGIRDGYAQAKYVAGPIGPVAGPALQVVYHDFRADRGGLHYGTEWDVLLSARVHKFGFALKYARYQADKLMTDTSKFWAQTEFVF